MGLRRALTITLLLVGFALPALAEPAPQRFQDPVFSSWITHPGIVYGHATRWTGETQELQLDLFEPAGDAEPFRPVVVWAHGGFFKGGNRQQVGPLHEFTRRGFVTASISYRLRPEMPNQGLSGIEQDPIGTLQRSEGAIRDGVHDLYAAVRWLRANAATYRIDPSRIVVAGFSAGGTMATVAPFVYETDPGDSGNPGWSSRPAAGLAFAGGYHDPLIVHHGAPPLFVGHGTQDTTTPFAASLPHCLGTRVVGNVCELHAERGAGHGIFGVEPAIGFVHRHVIAPERIRTRLVDVTVTPRGGTVTVAGWLRTDQGDAVADARVLVGDPSGRWTAADTDGDGRFQLTVPTPDHGQEARLQLRYEGQEAAPHVGLGRVRVPPAYEDEQVHVGAPIVDLALSGRTLAPTHQTIVATWGASR